MYSPPQYFQVTMASGSTYSSWVTLNVAYARVFLEVPTMTSGSDIMVVASFDGSKVCRLMGEVPATSSVQVNTFTIASAITGGRMVPLPLGSFKYMGVELVSAPTANSSVFRFHCS